jgi:hypothetical protein
MTYAGRQCLCFDVYARVPLFWCLSCYHFQSFVYTRIKRKVTRRVNNRSEKLTSHLYLLSSRPRHSAKSIPLNILNRHRRLKRLNHSQYRSHKKQKLIITDYTSSSNSTTNQPTFPQDLSALPMGMYVMFCAVQCRPASPCAIISLSRECVLQKEVKSSPHS